MGTPPMIWNCLGVSLPNRSPRPAATTMAPTSRGKRPHQLIHVVQTNQRRPWYLHRTARRAEHPMEALPYRLGDPPLRRAARPDLSPEPDLTQEDHIGRSGPIVEAGQQRRRHRQIGAWLIEPDPGRDLEEYIQVGER